WSGGRVDARKKSWSTSSVCRSIWCLRPLRIRRSPVNVPVESLLAPHNYPGRLFIVEGIDGSGKSTQIHLLERWLRTRGFQVYFTEWNSADLVKKTTKKGKKKRSLTPTTFSLLHATDFAHRLVSNILPPLKAGMIVLASAYAFTRFP